MKLLERHFEIALETPDGIKKLRELILTLAMQGKLVVQDPKDQPASELLKEIEKEKKRLIENKLLKIGQLTKDTKRINQSIQIPFNWQWAKGEEIFFITKLAGFEYTKHIKLMDYGDVPVIRAQNVRPLNLDFNNLKYIDRKTSELLDRCALKRKALLVTFIGAGIGDVGLFDRKERWHLAPNVAKMEPFENCEEKIDLRFVNYYLLSKIGRAEIFKHLKSTAQPSISMGTIRDIDYPIPPISEQKRIVAKIDQLMALCDKLEAERDARNNKRLKIHTSAINKLLSASDNSDFNTSWNFITKNFNELYSVPENVEELKKAILQLAVMGKLVPQDTKDQPAEEFFKKIEVQKNRIIEERKIRKQELTEKEDAKGMLTTLPKGWAYMSLLGLGYFLGGKTPSTNKPAYWHGTIPWVSAKDMKFALITDSQDHVTQAGVESGLAIIPKKSILMVVRSGILRRTFPVAINSVLCTINQDLKALVPFPSVYSEYILLMLKGFETFILSNLTKRGMTVESVTFDEFIAHKWPIPPLAEQKRIVAKIDQLMSLCNTLEHQIKDSTDKQTAILNAVLAKL